MKEENSSAYAAYIFMDPRGVAQGALRPADEALIFCVLLALAPFCGAYLCYAYAGLEAATVVQRVTYELRYLGGSSVNGCEPPGGSLRPDIKRRANCEHQENATAAPDAGTRRFYVVLERRTAH